MLAFEKQQSTTRSVHRRGMIDRYLIARKEKRAQGRLVIKMDKLGEVDRALAVVVAEADEGQTHANTTPSNPQTFVRTFNFSSAEKERLHWQTEQTWVQKSPSSQNPVRRTLLKSHSSITTSLRQEDQAASRFLQPTPHGGVPHWSHGGSLPEVHVL